MLKQTTNKEYQKVKTSLDDSCGCSSSQSPSGGIDASSPSIACCIVDEDIVSDVIAGAINPLDVVPKGSNLTDFIKQLLLKDFVPTYVDPTFALTNSSAYLKVIGEIIDFNLIFTTYRGRIVGATIDGVWNPTAFQADLIGAAIAYSYYYPDNNLIGTGLNTTQAVVDYEMIQGLNTFKAVQNYAQGPQPVDSKGNPVGTPEPAGTSPIVTSNIEGVYPIFATTQDISFETEQPLVSMLTGNNVEIPFVAETGSDKQFFEMPDPWTNVRPITKIEYFNVVTNQFDPVNKLGDFDPFPLPPKTIWGYPVDYTRYTNNSLKRGILKIRLIF